MLSYCEVTVTPFFFLYFTIGGRPIKLSSGNDGTGVQVDLVLATLEIKKVGGGRNTQSQQSQGGQRRSQPQGTAVRDQNGVRNANENNKSFAEQESADRRQEQQQKHQQQISEEHDDELVVLDENGPFSDITAGNKEKEKTTGDMGANSSRNNEDTIVSKEKPIIRRRLKRLLDSDSDEDN